jgi:dihydrofolate reductase
MSIQISLIVAISKNFAIGKDNKLLWRLPIDMKFFRQTTLNHAVIMGRKTFESLGNKPLTDRLNIVITSQKDFEAEGIKVVHSKEEALKVAQSFGKEEVFIMGGGEIYRLFMPLAQKLYLTEINIEIEGDTYFSDFQKNEWKEISKTHYEKDEKHQYEFDIICYQRI